MPRSVQWTQPAGGDRRDEHLDLSAPIVRITSAEIFDTARIDELKSVLRWWVSREQECLRLFANGFRVAPTPSSYITNQIPQTRIEIQPALNLVIEPNDVLLFPESWATFWSGFTHAIRNAVDHGIESPEERLAAGKPAQGKIRLTTRLLDDDLLVEIADDGRGIAWNLVRARAAAVGLAHDTREDLTEALFQDGLSTKGEVSEFSGRGIGMGALRAISRKMGGSVQVTSAEGQGTCLSFRWTKMHDRVDSLVLCPISTSPTETQTQAAGGHLQ